MRINPFVIAASLLLSAPVFSGEFVINLKDPVYSDGVVKTDQGGVIEAQGLRIQARKIVYTNRKDCQNVYACGDLMMEYCGQIFVGEELEFNLLDRTGYLIDGRTNVNIWYMGGRRLELLANGDYKIYDGFFTTSSNRKSSWKFSAEDATITDDNAIHARNVTLKAMDVPLLWVPYMRSSLERFIDPPLRYRILWDKGLGPRLSLRYRFFSTESFNAYARFDYRLKLGPGGALEAEYKSKDKCTLFQTRNYAAHDKEFSDENGLNRYRFQGIFKTKSKDEYSRFHVQWDRLSDNRMVSDFRDSDFEVNTEKVTYLEAAHYNKYAFGNLTVRPKLNYFDSLNQELPYAVFGLKPFSIWRSGIISENYLSGGYLDYTFARGVDNFLRDRKAGRFETLNTLYRPFSFYGLTATPKIGIVGIYYTDSPENKAEAQFLYTYGGDANMRFSRNFDSLKHTIEPYARYIGYSRPRVPVNDYFVFDIHDGLDQLDQLRFGVRQLIHNRSNPIFLPLLTLDLYSYGFWGANSFDQTFPKAFADIQLNRPNYALFGGIGYNIQENVLDYGNARFLYTVNASLAFGVELRHRSKYWWRKAIHDNYFVDFARPLDELLASPLSDKRNTLLTKAHLRLTPRWNLNLQTFHGWGRSNEPFYNGAKLDFYTMVTGSWQMKLTYEYMPNDPYRFSYSFKLIK